VLELGGKGGESGLYSTVGDLARWGAFLCDPDESVLAPASVAEMHDLQSWPSRLDARLGPRDRALAARRADLRGHTGGFPGFLSILALLAPRPDRRGRADERGQLAEAEPTGLELAEAALEELAPELEPWRPEEAPPARSRRCWAAGGRRATRRSSAGAAASSRRGSRTAPPEREPSVFEPEGDDRFRVVSGRERGEVLRVVRDEDGDVVKLYWATYPFTRDARRSSALETSGRRRPRSRTPRRRRRRQQEEPSQRRPRPSASSNATSAAAPPIAASSIGRK
jgi:hypothetical protein